MKDRGFDIAIMIGYHRECAGMITGARIPMVQIPVAERISHDRG